MIAPKPGTHEWKRMIFMALAGGVTLKRVTSRTSGGGFRYTSSWVARFQDGSVCCVRDTKYEAAQFAVSTLMGNSPPLFDAANAQSAP